MKTKTLIVLSVSCVSLLAGCTLPTAHKDAWTVKPTMVVEPRRENPQAWYDLGRYYQGQARHALAISALEKAVEVDASFVEARNRLAVSYAALGRHADAIRQLEAAIQTSPGAAHIYSNLGYTYYLKGSPTEAASALQRAIALDPENRHALNNLGMVYAQLGETEKSRSAFAQAAVNQPATAIQSMGGREESLSQIVQVAPNVYELRPRPAPAADVMPQDQALASRARVEVSNGNGVKGMARKVGFYLKEGGFAATRLTNFPGFNVAVTRVEYRSGHEVEARQVAAAMPFKVEVVLSTDLRRDTGVRLVLGKDLMGSTGYFKQHPKPTSPAQDAQRRY